MTETEKTLPSTQTGGERLQKVLARCGLGSRREIEGWISQGRVRVNGQVASLGVRLGAEDQVRLDNRPVVWREPEGIRVLAYNKPEGQISSRRDPEGRASVFDGLPSAGAGRWVAVGRLDINTTGLLLFTNSGELANRLMHPSRQIEREYAVRVFGEVTEDNVRALFEGVELEDGMARFTDIVDTGNSGMNRWFHVCLLEGRQREVRRLWESQGLRVSRLKRVRYGSVIIPDHLRQGHWCELDAGEVAKLTEQVEMTAPARSGPPPARNSRNTRRGGKTGTGRTVVPGTVRPPKRVAGATARQPGRRRR